MDDSQALIAGEALIDLFPETGGRLADVETFRRAAGGAPANVAVAMARLEDPALLWTRLGDDPFGEHLADVLAANDVPDELIVVDDDRKTAHTLVGDDPDADQSFTFYKEESATMAMEAGSVSGETLDEVGWVHVGGVMFCEEPARSAMFDLVERAHDHGCQVSFDPNTRLDLWPDRAVLEETIERALEHVDVLKTDQEDLSFLLEGAEDIDGVARSLSEYGPHTVLLTRGGGGAHAYATEEAPWGPETVDQSGFEVDVVETTGAGDAFLSGAIVRLRETGSLSDAVRFANAVGALATTEVGAMAGLPDRDAVEALLEQ